LLPPLLEDELLDDELPEELLDDELPEEPLDELLDDDSPLDDDALLDDDDELLVELLSGPPSLTAVPHPTAKVLPSVTNPKVNQTRFISSLPTRWPFSGRIRVWVA